ncbi:nuclear transport factor 2 family protein [Aquimarina sp. MMG015]|uniref:nuclear transport factor 2 family protein n=1 Tax=Aquimarina sp. MMG015 TaxID=2822689 RepID=UPI001B3A04E5|nr:nuclear transport factor 2 family protein [Aquimarina sp. MMG015]MBQ4804094.1 nuclear transport factor 2 family protein [Aquimarina sp. MMG015]
MIRFFIPVFMLFSSIMLGQVNSSEIQKQIDQTVWKPFQKAYEALDAVSLNAIYADEVLRVTPKGIDTKNVFKSKNVERLKASKESNTQIKLDFWFDSRHTNDDTSYEVGFYKIGITADNKTQYLYGQFHIALKKINGVWKITQDWDTTTINGKPITKEDFEKKKSLRF